MDLPISQWWLDSHKTCKGECGGWIAMKFSKLSVVAG